MFPELRFPHPGGGHPRQCGLVYIVIGGISFRLQ